MNAWTPNCFELFYEGGRQLGQVTLFYEYLSKYLRAYRGLEKLIITSLP